MLYLVCVLCRFGVGDNLEGRHNRRVKTCATQHYMIFNKDPKLSTHNSYVVPSKTDAYTEFMQVEFGFFARGNLPLSLLFLSCVAALSFFSVPKCLLL